MIKLVIVGIAAVLKPFYCAQKISQHPMISQVLRLHETTGSRVRLKSVGAINLNDLGATISQ